MKIIITSIGLLLISVLIADILHLFVFTNLNDWTYVLIKKYIIYQITKTDLIVFKCAPLLVAIFFLFYDKSISVAQLIRVNIQILMVILLFLLFAIIIAPLTWSSPSNEYLPSYILIQPFHFYWTPFILTGIFFPLYLRSRKRNKKRISHDIIDEGIK